MSANDHLVDSPVKLGTCNRCRAYVYLAHSSGIRSAADVAPAGRDAYVAAALDGRRHFDLVEAAGRPSKLLTRTRGSQAPSFTLEGAQEAVQGRRPVLVEHGCGGHAQNMIKFTEVEERPPSAPAMPGERRGGHRQPPVHESGLTVEEIPRPYRVAPATRRRSDRWERPPKCGTCRKECKPGTYSGIQRGREWIWAEHDDGYCT